MTIERQWLEVMKTEVPEAFVDEIPFEPEAGFIDAQIKLMSMPHENTWDVFLSKQIRSPVMNLIGMGASTVILAFDDYALVPRAKSITQAKRRQGLVPIEFKDEDPFPSEPPAPWNAAMANRVFKARVVEYICQNMRDLLYDLPRGRTVVVDWRGETQESWSFGPDGLSVAVSPRMQVGEADIKFSRWARKLGVPMAVEAIDGDFVPIALASGCPSLLIWRYKVLKDSMDASRSYEWVNVDLLGEGMRRAISQTRVSGISLRWDNWELHCLLALIALTGTDYSRNMPLVGPRKVWSMLPKVLPVLTAECMRTEEGKPFLVPDLTSRWLYGKIYGNAFYAHVRDDTLPLHGVRGAIQNSKLSSKTKSLIPSLERAACTAKNANFIMSYWLGHDPDSMDPSYGFREREGVVEWDD
jgi:hypothetical protein